MRMRKRVIREVVEIIIRKWDVENLMCKYIMYTRSGWYEPWFGQEYLTYVIWQIQLGKSYTWFLISTCILNIVQIFISHFAFLSITLWLSQKTMFTHPLHLSMPWSLVNTVYSIYRVQHTPNTAYTKCSIHRLQHTPNTVSTHDCVSSTHSHACQLTP